MILKCVNSTRSLELSQLNGIRQKREHHLIILAYGI